MVFFPWIYLYLKKSFLRVKTSSFSFLVWVGISYKALETVVVSKRRIG
jgi:hypothetical protein